ncbi:cyclodeaminase/cyclohydrolase family protein [Amycolatopsis sp., V23-08]|uniref:Cyclodeaminase/cyclohydrolase family protein n=1 Tax=Amycolatopsis heterodermiae TaxID=3110235 RepID=A0ABU5QVM5_9PSEU|nr:cyclodeaminase/cyclohydrolase family protein [Amycolatopsis sp., V23-08]MEA5357962.1 cyclodeaminase/cyclohydrolase family protein [Amycolatopsis sp., V23-08]
MRDQIMSDFLKALASRDASPGGGATAALHVAQAAALVAGCAGDRDVVAEARALSMHALRLAEKAAHAVATVGRARPDDQQARRNACVPPADVIAASAVVLDLVERVPPDPRVVTDLAAAAEAARAAAVTARVSIEVQLAGLPEDTALRESVATVGEICERADRVTEGIRSGVALSR